MTDLQLAEINWLAVLAGAAAHMVLGFLWYGPLFGNLWIRGIGKTREEIAGAQSAMPYTVSIISAVLLAFGLALLLTAPEQVDLVTGLTWGLIAGLLFVAPVLATTAVFESRPLSVTLLAIGYAVVGLAIMGAILGAWR